MTTAPLCMRGAWRDSLSWLALLAAFAVGIGIVHDAARVLCRAQQVQQRRDLRTAALAAEAALMLEFLPAHERPAAGPALPVPTQVARRDDSWFVATHLGGGTSHWFRAESLPGAAPAALARPALVARTRWAAGDTWRGTPIAGLPPLDPAALAAAPLAECTSMLRRDPGVALHHFAAGTDADDFVLQDDRPRAAAASPGLIVVPGNLWIEPGPAPLELALRQDLVLVVTGNVYLMRSLHVPGPGRLLLVAAMAAGAVTFADADFNGRWAAGETMHGGERFAGPIEGAGACYVATSFTARGGSIACQAGLVVAGPLHLGSDAGATGPLLLGNGIVVASGSETLTATHEWGYAPERERVPGFATSGAPRPGRLRYLGPGAPAELGSRHETLYPSVPAR